MTAEISEPKSFEKRNPSDGTLIKNYEITSESAVEAAIIRAKAGFRVWRAFTIKERFKYIKRIKNICVKEVDYIAEQISLDTGKPRFEAVSQEILGVPGAIDYYEKIAQSTLGRKKRRTPIIFPGKSSYVEYFPMGVIGIISPWNFPFQLTMLPVLSALIAGNSVILKPSEYTPITGELVREIFERAHFPEGVIQILQGDGTTGAALAKSDVAKIFFTGSVATGKKIMAAAAEKLTPIELELGGKDPLIVCKDANLDRAAGAAIWGSLANCGQICTSVERIFVVEEVYEKFMDRLRERIKNVTVGDPESGSDVGPMVNSNQVKIVETHIKDAIAKGATIEFGGSRIDKPGNWFEPTLLSGVTTEMDIYREETFGPVVSVIKVANEEEAIFLANDHKYGLTGSIWTSDYSRGLKLASELESGQASVNDVIQSVGNIVLPFGGIKSSGIGRYHGPEGLRAFSHVKAIQGDRGWIDKEIAWFPYKGKYESMVTATKGLASGNLPKALLPMIRLFRKTK